MSAGKPNALIGHLAAAGAYVIFGLNIIFCKDLSRSGILSPMALFTLRAIGASLLFWLASAFVPREKVDPGDFPKIILAALIGFVSVQLSFLFALPYAKAIDIALVSNLSPVFTMIFAAMFIGEPMTWKKILGVLVSLAGVIVIILDSTHAGGGVERTTWLGFVLLFVNAISFAAYLGIFRPLISKYHVVTFMKWVFLFSFLSAIPFSAREIVCFDFSGIDPKLLGELAYLVVMATFVSYFLIPLAQKNIRPTLVSMYSYLQPIIAAIIGIATGMDSMSVLKAVAIVLVFSGVWAVNKSRSALS